MKKYQNFCLLCLLPLCILGCKEDRKEPQQAVDNTVFETKKEEKKLLYIKCSQFENKNCLPGHTLEGSCAAKDENGRVYIEVDGKQLHVKNGERLRIYNFNNLWFFRKDFGFDDKSEETHVLKTTGDPGEDESKAFIGGNQPCVCEEGKKIPSGAACKTVPVLGNCYVDLGNGIVDIQGYDIMGSLFNRINAAFGDTQDLVHYFPLTSGDLIYVSYIRDRFAEYKDTVITLFNTIKLGIVLVKNADELKEYINKAADRFEEYYRLEAGGYKDSKPKPYKDELKRIAKVREDLLGIVDAYKDTLFMTDEELAQNKLRRMNSFGERDPEDDECGRYSL